MKLIKMKLLTGLFVLLCCTTIYSQISTQNARRLRSGTAVPSGACVIGPPYTDLYIRTTTGIIYYCSGTSTWTAATGGGGGGTPGGANTNVQYNDSGAFGGDSGMVYNKTTHAFTITGAATALSLSTGSSPPSLTVGTGGAFGLGEGTAATAAASVAVCYADSTSHTIKCSYNNGSFFSIPLVIASGATAMATAAISSGTCATVVQATATGALTTDAVVWSFNADVSGVTGYAPSANGGLHILVNPIADKAEFRVCNDTSASITPGAVTLNWRIIR